MNLDHRNTRKRNVDSHSRSENLYNRSLAWFNSRTAWREYFMGKNIRNIRAQPGDKVFEDDFELREVIIGNSMTENSNVSQNYSMANRPLLAVLRSSSQNSIYDNVPESHPQLLKNVQVNHRQKFKQSLSGESSQTTMNKDERFINRQKETKNIKLSNCTVTIEIQNPMASKSTSSVMVDQAIQSEEQPLISSKRLPPRTISPDNTELTSKITGENIISAENEMKRINNYVKNQLMLLETSDDNEQQADPLVKTRCLSEISINGQNDDELIASSNATGKTVRFVEPAKNQKRPVIEKKLFDTHEFLSSQKSNAKKDRRINNRISSIIMSPLCKKIIFLIPVMTIFFIIIMVLASREAIGIKNTGKIEIDTFDSLNEKMLLAIPPVPSIPKLIFTPVSSTTTVSPLTTMSAITSTFTPVSSTTISTAIETTEITEPTTTMPTTSTDMPTSSTDMPTSSTAMPTSSTDMPTSSTTIPTSSTTMPTSSTAMPTTSTDMPTTSTDMPTTSTDMPTTSTTMPTTSTVNISDLETITSKSTTTTTKLNEDMIKKNLQKEYKINIVYAKNIMANKQIYSAIVKFSNMIAKEITPNFCTQKSRVIQNVKIRFASEKMSVLEKTKTFAFDININETPYTLLQCQRLNNQQIPSSTSKSSFVRSYFIFGDEYDQKINLLSEDQWHLIEPLELIESSTSRYSIDEIRVIVRRSISEIGYLSRMGYFIDDFDKQNFFLEKRNPSKKHLRIKLLDNGNFKKLTLNENDIIDYKKRMRARIATMIERLIQHMDDDHNPKIYRSAEGFGYDNSLPQDLIDFYKLLKNQDEIPTGVFFDSTILNHRFLKNV